MTHKKFTVEQLELIKDMPMTPDLLYELSKEGGSFGTAMRMELEEKFPNWRPES